MDFDRQPDGHKADQLKQICSTCGELFDPQVDVALTDGSGRCLYCIEEGIGLDDL